MRLSEVCGRERGGQMKNDFIGPKLNQKMIWKHLFYTVLTIEYAPYINWGKT